MMCDSLVLVVQAAKAGNVSACLLLGTALSLSKSEDQQVYWKLAAKHGNMCAQVGYLPSRSIGLLLEILRKAV